MRTPVTCRCPPRPALGSSSWTTWLPRTPMTRTRTSMSTPTAGNDVLAGKEKCMEAELADLEAEAFRAARGMLDGRVVILTGATGGIGSTIARMLAAAGARLALTDLAGDRVAALATELDCF